MSDYAPKRGDTAEYTFPTAPKWAQPGANDGQTVTGHVLAVGKTHADVRWHNSDRIERIHFRNPDGVTFKPADTN